MLDRNTIHHAELFELCGQMDNESVNMILCDLPYGVTALKGDGAGQWDNIIPIPEMWEQFKRIIKPRGAIVLTASQPFTSRLVSSNYDMFQYEWVWLKDRKTNFLNAKIMPMRQHEDVLIFGHQKPNYYPQMIETERRKTGGINRQGLVYGSFGDNVSYRTELYPSTPLKFNCMIGLHPTQKPVKLFEYLIKTYTQEGELVFDPTCGSGTTAVAARNTGRDYICGDYLQEYADMARERVRNSDPYKPTTLKNGSQQLSLFDKGDDID